MGKKSHVIKHLVKMLRKPLVFFVVTVIINVILLVSVIDIHYRISDHSPLIKNQCLLHTNTSQKSKRLVFILSDGLRSDSLFQVTAQSTNSFLRKKMENGTWGISVAAVPTLTRQGLFSIISGRPFTSSDLFGRLTSMFSLISNNTEVTDNIFNYARTVFFVGSLQVTNYFGNQSNSWIKKGYKNSHYTNCHENYACYDNYSFDKLNEFLNNKTLMKKDDIIFFIYLYAQDYCGHNKTPLSQICLDEIKLIDKRLTEAVEKIEHVFNDGLTTYLLTSDHGMTDWGVHGWVSNQETHTPYVLWGHGVAKAGKFVNSPKNWGAKYLIRYDMNQIDLASLLSVLLGKPIPRENIGLLHHEILSYDEEQKAKAMFCNLKGIQYLVDELMTINSLMDFQTKNVHELNNKTNVIEEILESGNFSHVITSSTNLVKEYLSIYAALTQDLYKVHLIIVIASVYVGWGLYLLTEFFLLSSKRSSYPKANFTIVLLFVVFTIALTMFVVYSNMPTHFLVYHYLSVVCWLCFLLNFVDIIYYIHSNRSSLKFSMLSSNVMEKLITFGLSFVVILCINKYYAAQYFLMFLAISLLLSDFKNLSLLKPHPEIPSYLCASWLCSAITLMFVIAYPILDLKPNLHYTQMSVVCWIFLVIMYIYYGNCSKKDSIFAFISLFSIIIAIMNVTAMTEKKASPNFMISWILLITILYPILSGQKGIKRVFHIVFALGVPFILMSVRQEPIGLLSFAIHIISWVCLEMLIKTSDVFRAFYFLFYVWIGYFAIGNYDYPTSFDIAWTRCFFTTVGDSMIPLILYKQLIPIIILNACVITIYKKINRDVFPMIVWYLFLNNGIAFYFFLCTKGKNYGEVQTGHSIMHHVLSQTFPIAVTLLMPLAKLLVNLELSKKQFFSNLVTILSKKKETENEINMN